MEPDPAARGAPGPPPAGGDLDEADMRELRARARQCQPHGLRPLADWLSFDWDASYARPIGRCLRLWNDEAGVWERCRVMNYSPRTRLHYLLRSDAGEMWADLSATPAQMTADFAFVAHGDLWWPVRVLRLNEAARRLPWLWVADSDALVEYIGCNEVAVLPSGPSRPALRALSDAPRSCAPQLLPAHLELSRDLFLERSVRSAVEKGFRRSAAERCGSCEACGSVSELTGGAVGERRLRLCPECLGRARRKEYCPVCSGLYNLRAEDEEKDSRMVNCHACKMWVHIGCDGIGVEEYEQIESGTSQHLNAEFLCPTCRSRLATSWIDALSALDSAGLFLEPVTEDIAPGYFEAIERPMDLQSMRAKALRGVYRSAPMVRSDLELMVLNSLRYNVRGGEVWRLTEAFYLSCMRVFGESAGGEMELLGATAPTDYGLLIREALEDASEQREMTRVLREREEASRRGPEPGSRRRRREVLHVPAAEGDAWPAARIPPQVLRYTERHTAHGLSFLDLCSACGSRGDPRALRCCALCGECYHAFCAEAFRRNLGLALRCEQPGGAYLCPNCVRCPDCAGGGCGTCTTAEEDICAVCRLPLGEGILGYSIPPKGCEACGRRVHPHCDRGACDQDRGYLCPACAGGGLEGERLAWRGLRESALAVRRRRGAAAAGGGGGGGGGVGVGVGVPRAPVYDRFSVLVSYAVRMI